MIHLLQVDLPSVIHLEDSICIAQPFPPHPYHWEVLIPSGLFQVSTTCTLSKEGILEQRWFFEPHSIGEFTLIFYYRKSCCGYPIIKTLEYPVTVLS